MTDDIQAKLRAAGFKDWNDLKKRRLQSRQGFLFALEDRNYAKRLYAMRQLRSKLTDMMFKSLPGSSVGEDESIEPTLDEVELDENTRRLRDFLDAFTDEDVDFMAFLIAVRRRDGWLHQHLAALERIWDFIEKDAKTIASLRKQVHSLKLAELARRVGPRKTDRDAEIVKMHDVDKLSYGHIAKKLKMTSDAVAKAYKRRKAKEAGKSKKA